MYQPPLIAKPSVDMGHADGHRMLRATIHNDLAPLKANRIGEVAARKHDRVLWNQRPTLEAAADPTEGLW